jgi:uncharacterized membrane protein YeiB
VTAPGVPPAGAVALRDRALAPDAARGAMLLLIALANVHFFLFDRPLGVRSYPAALTGMDRVVAGVQLVLVDGRAYPLFGLLFGYGLGQLAARRAAAGVRAGSRGPPRPPAWPMAGRDRRRARRAAVVR